MPTTCATRVLLLGVAIVGSNALLLSPIPPEAAATFGMSSIRVSWAISAYGGAAAVPALPLAPLIDRVPRCSRPGGPGLRHRGDDACAGPRRPDRRAGARGPGGGTILRERVP
jgi:MFS family permease